MILLLTLLLANPATLAEVDGMFGYGVDRAREVQAANLLDRAVAEAPADYELLWRAARANYWLGNRAMPKERLAWYERGIELGKRAVAQKPDGVEGHFWLGASYGGYCEEKGGLTAFRNVKLVRTEMQKVLQLNDAYEEGSAYTALGEIDRQLPGLFGGNLKRGTATLQKGLSIAPGNAEIRLALANAYLKAKRKDDALAQLHELLQMEFTSPRAIVGRRTQDKAQVLLNKIEKK